MGVLDRMFAPAEVGEDRNLSLTDYTQWVELGLVGMTPSGVPVNPETAMRYSAIYGAVRIISETIAMLPLIVYERESRGKRRAPDHPLFSVLKDRPNEWMTSFEMRETLQGHLGLWGNAYSHVTYRPDGQVEEIFPLRPDRMLRDEEIDGERLYQYQMPNGSTRWFTGVNIWHLRGLGSDGKRGYSPIHLMRRSIGIGIAAEDFGGRFFANDATPGGVLEHPQQLSPDAHKRLRDSWEARHAGLTKSHKLAILEEGMKYHEIGLPPGDAQFLETRKFQVSEIARIFRVPPHMLADLDRATFSNIEHQSIEFVVYMMGPWFKRWEQSIHQNLMLPKDRDRYFPEFLVEGLLRGDIKSRYEAYAVGRQNGWLSANDIRELENQNPVDGGDIYLVPLNMVPADSVTGLSLQRDQKRKISSKEKRSITLRRRIQQRHRPLFEDAFRRLMERQHKDIIGHLEANAGRAVDPVFLDWLHRYFIDQQESVAAAVRPLFNAMSASVAQAAADEVGIQASQDAVDNLVQSYSKAFAGRTLGESERRLIAAMERAETLEDIPELVRAEIESWPDARVPTAAGDETVQLGNSTARMIFVAAGIASLVWRSVGESCPYCVAMDGASVGTNEHFLSIGQEFLPDGASNPLTTGVNVKHPPLHSGCDCVITAGG